MTHNIQELNCDLSTQLKIKYSKPECKLKDLKRTNIMNLICLGKQNMNKSLVFNKILEATKKIFEQERDIKKNYISTESFENFTRI